MCHFFQLASHWDPPRFRWMRAKAPARVNAPRCLALSQVCLFVRMCTLHAWVKISFLYTICKNEFAEEQAPSVCFGFVSLVPQWSHRVDIALYCLFVEAMCIRSALHTFPVNVGLWKITASLASSVEQTTALSKYLPAPTLSQLAQVDFRAKVQMRPGHALMTSNWIKCVPPHTFCCI